MNSDGFRSTKPRMKLLPPSSVHLLSSGQVVTSVVSVVKELVENAVDAAATKIEVKLEKFGFDKIEVHDNGLGIATCEAKLMALPHYTSKITAFTDVESLTTYGFRGEALSSIAAVADLSLLTKTADESIGSLYKFDHKGNVESSKPIAACTGTAVMVTNLFKNIPVRRQICKNERVQKRELKQIEELLMQFAVAWPQTRISLYHNRCLIWSKTSVPDVDSALTQICGRNWTSCMQKIQIQDSSKKISLEAFLPTHLEATAEGERSRTFILINRRPVIMKEIDKMVKKAFVQVPALKEKSNLLSYCIYLTVPPSALDVNLEPNKTKVMLQDKETILALLSEVLDKLYNNSVQQASLDNRCAQQANFSNNHLSNDSGLELEHCVPNSTESNVSDMPKTKNRIENRDIERKRNISAASNVLHLNEDEQSSSLTDLCVTEGQCCDVKKSGSNLIAAHNSKLRTLPNTANTSPTDQTMLEEGPESAQSTVCLINEEPTTQSYVLEDSHLNNNESLEVSLLNLNSRQKPQNGNKAVNNEHAVRHETNTDIEMEIEIENQLLSEERNGFQTAWSKGTLKDTTECVLQPVKLLNPLTKRPVPPSEDFGGKNNNISPPTNPKKKKRTSNSDGQTTLYSMTQNLSTKHQLSGYTLFARDVRLEVMSENPSADFSKISKIIYEKWQNLSAEEQEEYESKSQCRQTSLKQKLGKDRTKLTAVENKPAKDSPHNPLKNLVRVKVVQVEFDLNKFQERIARSKKDLSTVRVNPNEYQYISQLVLGCWVCCDNNQLGFYNHFRAREILLFFNMMSNHKIPTKRLDCPLVLNESLVGGSQYWTTLMTLSSSPGVPPCYQYLDDSRILSNGIKIKKWQDEITKAYHAEIVGLADCMAFFGVGDLKEVLKKLCANKFLTVEESRTLKVVNYFKEEVVRMVRQLPLKISKDDVTELNHRLMKVPLSRRTTCLHGYSVFEPIFKIQGDNSV